MLRHIMPARPSEGLLHRLSNLSKLEPNAEGAARLLVEQVRRRQLGTAQHAGRLSETITIQDVSQIISEVEQRVSSVPDGPLSE